MAFSTGTKKTMKSTHNPSIAEWPSPSPAVEGFSNKKAKAFFTFLASFSLFTTLTYFYAFLG